MSLHPSTFEYLKPTEAQLKNMNILRGITTKYATEVDLFLPEGPDKTYILRRIRETAMWMNVAITRLPDGTPRTD
jgi:hypothetical protein